MPDPIEPADDGIQAGELALGVLAGEDRAQALRRVVAEPAFAAEVDAWRSRLAPLMDGIAAMPAPAGAWAGVERAIGTAAHVALGRWRAAALAASAVAAGLAGVLVLQPAPEPVMIAAPAAPTAPLLAQVAGAKGVILVSAQYDAATGALRVRTSNLPEGDRVPELWIIAGSAAPRSLGIVAANGASSYTPPASLRRIIADGVTIAVTLEPRLEAPHAAPTGAILGTAKLIAV